MNTRKVELVQVAFRDGRQGNVMDVYELCLDGHCILTIEHAVEYSLEEVPLHIEVGHPELTNVYMKVTPKEGI